MSQSIRFPRLDLQKTAARSADEIANDDNRCYPKVIRLDKAKITIGRAATVDYCILSQSISRLHASLEKTSEGYWTISDCNSTNGVMVSNVLLRPGVPHRLVSGDVVKFGRDEDMPTVSYRFRLPEIPVYSGSTTSDSDTEFRPKIKRRRKRVIVDSPIVDSPRYSVVRGCFDDELLKLRREIEDRRKSEEALENEMRRTKDKLEELQRATLEAKERLETEVKRLVRDRCELESTTRKEKSRLETKLLLKEAECQKLRDKLDASSLKKQQDLQCSQSPRKGDAVVGIVSNLMETELQCVICSEIFVKATTLQCSHTFCGHCIAEWLKKKNDCPVCRQPMSSFVQIKAMDEFINKTVDVLSTDLCQRRSEMLRERASVESVPAAPSTSRLPPPPTTTVDEHVMTRSRTRSGRPVRVPNPAVILELSSQSESSIDGFDAHTDMFESSEWDSEEMDGDHGAYYGGYGECYHCGYAGHWANGCPYR